MRIRKPVIFIAIAMVAAALLTIHLGLQRHHTLAMDAMNRQKLSVAEFEKFMAETVTKPVYQAAGRQQQKVLFAFNLAPAQVGDVTLVIRSNDHSILIYRGPYQQEISVSADPSFFEEGGQDSFKFLILKKDSNEVLVAEHEARFWLANKRVRIDFLPERAIDEKTGVPVAFKVSVE